MTDIPFQLSCMRKGATQIASSELVLNDASLREKANEVLRSIISLQQAVAYRQSKADAEARAAREAQQASEQAELRNRAIAAGKGMGDAQRCLLSQFAAESIATTDQLSMLAGVDERQAVRSLRLLEQRGLVYEATFGAADQAWRPTELGDELAQLIADDAFAA